MISRQVVLLIPLWDYSCRPVLTILQSDFPQLCNFAKVIVWIENALLMVYILKSLFDIAMRKNLYVANYVI